MRLRTLRLPTGWGTVELVGGTRAGDGTLLLLPQFKLALDIGRPHRRLPSMSTVCVSHGHVDHLGALAFWAAQRYLNAMGPATLCVPHDIEGDIARLLDLHARMEGGRPYDVTIEPVDDGSLHPLKRDLHLEFFTTDHWVPTLGNRLCWTRRRLLPEFEGESGDRLAELRRTGVEITGELVMPLVAYGADTGPGIFDDPRAIEAEIVLLECSFWFEEDIDRARRFGHLHLDDLISALPTLRCRHLVLLHASRRYRIREVEELIESRLAPNFGGELHHLIVDWE